MDAFTQKIKEIFEKGLSRPLDDECVDPLYTEVACTLSVSDCRAIILALTAVPEARATELAKGLIEIAELAMPDTYLATDARVQLARETLKSTDSEA